MRVDQIARFVFSCVGIIVWAMNIWGGWAELFYKKYKDSKVTWFWLRVTGIEPTEFNCIRFVKVISYIGIFLVSAGLIFAS